MAQIQAAIRLRTISLEPDLNLYPYLNLEPIHHPFPLLRQSYTTIKNRTTSNLLLRLKLRLPKLITPQDDIQIPLYRVHVLRVARIRRRKTPSLKLAHDVFRDRALGSEFLSRQGLATWKTGVLFEIAHLGDFTADVETDGFGLDDFVGAVDFG